jgi:hypothetical protein
MNGNHFKRDSFGIIANLPRPTPETSGQIRLAATWQEVTRVMAKLENYGMYSELSASSSRFLYSIESNNFWSAWSSNC